MSTSIERRNDVSRSFFIASRIDLQDRKQQMQKNIEKLLKKKNFDTINDSTILRMFKIVDEFFSLLFIKDNDIKQKLININKKLKRIDNNIFKTKTNIDTYAIAVKKKRFDEAEKTQNARRRLVAKTKQQKFFTKFKKKIVDDENQQRKKKAFIRHLFIKNFIQKLITMKKKEKRVLNTTFIKRRSEIVCKFRKDQNTYEKNFDVDE
jgi:hypothetical protein